MPDQYQAERTISAVFKEESQLDGVVRRLLDRGVPQDHISMMGKNFKSNTRITGFITKKDVILGGLRSGAIFGSLFGSFLSLLTGVGILFIPFVGSVVAAGPLGAVLLGAASGALAGSAGAGLVSALGTLGMPEDKAAIYQTRVEAGEFLVMAEVPADKASDIQLLLESAGGEEITVNEMTLPRASAGKYNSVADLSPEVRSHLSEEAQQTFIQSYNTALEQNNDPLNAEHAAWKTIHEQYDEDGNGVWSLAKATV
ncbi:ChaB family protein [Microcoleus sp. FACHB-672]|uniref:ChaB family protein n=1 Tax=Microcoleus sp. FACHB-672 TaxID=2692825 RepID=UPI001686417B|nr:ChaB family protein [Microcoleus sp. FACHB-672]MBD2043591.1 ChaB family protein [Microcoleus sp. FACHB-672]